MINEDIQRIKLKMQEEGVIINNPISTKEIAKFESNYKFILPEELVLFYTEIGNGCEMIDGFYLKGLEELAFDENKVKEDFIFSKYFIWEEDETNNSFDKVV